MTTRWRLTLTELLLERVVRKEKDRKGSRRVGIERWWANTAKLFLFGILVESKAGLYLFSVRMCEWWFYSHNIWNYWINVIFQLLKWTCLTYCVHSVGDICPSCHSVHPEMIRLTFAWHGAVPRVSLIDAPRVITPISRQWCLGSGYVHNPSSSPHFLQLFKNFVSQNSHSMTAASAIRRLVYRLILGY